MSVLRGVRGCKVSQQSKHPLFSLQRVLEPIMCGNSLWMCPAVQDSVPSGPHLKQGRDLQTERWTPQNWASHVCFIQHSGETEKMILRRNKTSSVNKWNAAFCFFVSACQRCVSAHIYFITWGQKSARAVTFWGLGSDLRTKGSCLQAKQLQMSGWELGLWWEKRFGHVVVGSSQSGISQCVYVYCCTSPIWILDFENEDIFERRRQFSLLQKAI